MGEKLVYPYNRRLGYLMAAWTLHGRGNKTSIFRASSL
jgi:hypothetical protein